MLENGTFSAGQQTGFSSSSPDFLRPVSRYSSSCVNIYYIMKGMAATGILLLAGGLAYTCTDAFKPKANWDGYTYDIAVIGGGSGGLATAFQARKHGMNVVVIDFVEETRHHTKWGIGGTCVNVGCIPKKLMHQAAKSHQQLLNSHDYGWKLPEDINKRTNADIGPNPQLLRCFNWKNLQQTIQKYIADISGAYQLDISMKDMLYENALATFKDQHSLLCFKNPQSLREYLRTGKESDCKEIKAKKIVIATGTRPRYLQCQGAELAITSDDIFYKTDPPGKTLVVGGGYVAVEIAGFLKGMGYDVTLMTRGDYLRQFDRDMVSHICNDLKQRRVKIVDNSLPARLQKQQEQIQVEVENVLTKVKTTEMYDTVLFAVGREPTTSLLNLEKVKVETKKGKIICNDLQTSVEHIYALGDVVDGLPQLSSTAMKMGMGLGRRIVASVTGHHPTPQRKEVSLRNYPTTVFTPLEYGCCGMSEEQAIQQYQDDIEVYHMKYQALEENILDKLDGIFSMKTKIYIKVIVRKQNDLVLGLHYAGPNAGEIMQGFAVAMQIGLTKELLDNTIGIHPTAAEEFTNVTVTKKSGENYDKSSC